MRSQQPFRALRTAQLQATRGRTPMVSPLLRPRSLIAVLFACVIATLVVLANAGYGPTLFGFLDSLPGGDKLGHVGLMGTLSLLVTFSLSPRIVRLGRVALPLGMLIVLVVITLEELSQYFFPARTVSLGDMACNTFGIIGGGLLASWAARRVGHGE